MTSIKVVNAAVAVLRAADGKVLLAKRPEGKPWAGWWEFPGGKIEDGETAFEALQRELHEELGTEAVVAYPWITRTFDYPDKTVKLHFFTIPQWTTEPHGKEGQLLSWELPDQLTVSPMLPANEPVLHALCLPDVYAITNFTEMGHTGFFHALKAALDMGLKLIQVREKSLSGPDLEKFASEVIALAKPYQAKVMINADVDLAKRLGADGVHLPSHQLMTFTEKPVGLLLAASCHTQAEMLQAQKLGADFVVLAPVLPTASHPGALVLGWQQFSALLKDSAMPVYALGGMQPQDMQTALEHGAHGISMQRAIWQSN